MGKKNVARLAETRLRRGLRDSGLVARKGNTNQDEAALRGLIIILIVPRFNLNPKC
jgi:hypothetical protein